MGGLAGRAYRRVLLAIRRDESRYLDEALSLLRALGIDGAEVIYVKRPSHRYYIQEDRVSSMASNGSVPDLVVVYDKLKP